MPSDPPPSLLTRPTLLFRLRDWKDSASWEEFYRLYHRLVFGLASRTGLTRVEAEEVTQDVFQRVSETIHEFESNPTLGSFRGWLMNLTRWRVSDKFRERTRAEVARHHERVPGQDDGTSTIERVPDHSPEALYGEIWEEEWKRHILDAALARLARKVPAKHYQAFDLYTRQQWPVLRVARELGIGVPTVYMVSHRLTKQLKIEVARLQTQLG